MLQKPLPSWGPYSREELKRMYNPRRLGVPKARGIKKAT